MFHTWLARLAVVVLLLVGGWIELSLMQHERHDLRVVFQSLWLLLLLFQSAPLVAKLRAEREAVAVRLAATADAYLRKTGKAPLLADVRQTDVTKSFSTE